MSEALNAAVAAETIALAHKNIPVLMTKSAQQEALLADLTTSFQRMSERQIDNARERAPTGGDLRRFIGQDGAVVLKSGVQNVNFAGRTLQVEVDGIFSGAPVDEWQAELHRLHTGRHFVGILLGNGNRKAATPILDAKLLAHAAKAPAYIRGPLEKAINKAMSDTAGSGGDWIPDRWDTALYEEFYAPAGIDSMFETRNIDGPTVLPAITDNIRPYLKGKVSTNNPSQYTASTPTTSSTTIDSAGMAARVLVDDSAAEDSMVPMLPEIMRRLARSLRDGYEDCMVNGDTAATHQDTLAGWNIRGRWGSDNLGGSSDHRRAFLGFRALAYDRSLTVDQGSGQTIAKVMEELLGGLGERGGFDAVLLVSPEVFFKKMLTDTNVLTVDKLGPAATLLRGQLAQIAGVPVVLTRWLSADLAATGLYTGSGAKSGVLALSRSEFAHYERRAAMVEVDKDITIGAHNLVATVRRSMRTLSGSSSQVARYGFNWL